MKLSDVGSGLIVLSVICFILFGVYAVFIGYCEDCDDSEKGVPLIIQISFSLAILGTLLLLISVWQDKKREEVVERA